MAGIPLCGLIASRQVGRLTSGLPRRFERQRAISTSASTEKMINAESSTAAEIAAEKDRQVQANAADRQTDEEPAEGFLPDAAVGVAVDGP